MFFKVPKSPVVIEVFSGLKIEVDPQKDKGVESALFYTGTYEAGTLSFITDYLNEGDCFVDIGANIGLMSITAAQKVGVKGKVVSFEPNPSTADILNRNIVYNRINNIEVIPIALGSALGKAFIYPNWHINRGGASLIRKLEGEAGIEVEVSTLDRLMDKRNLKPQMLKIDVEGFELEVLRGASSCLQNEFPPIVIVEISAERETSGGHFSSILEYINLQNQYDFYVNNGGKESKSTLKKIEYDGKLPSHDNVYCIPLWVLNK
ncbi:MAG: FkbM family methyltransferase [Bacteroidia bacterium]